MLSCARLANAIFLQRLNVSRTLINQSMHLDHGNRTIQGLWIGTDLSIMERLSITSFLQQGHDYHLYVYDELPNVPAGTLGTPCAGPYTTSPAWYQVYDDSTSATRPRRSINSSRPSRG